MRSPREHVRIGRRILIQGLGIVIKAGEPEEQAKLAEQECSEVGENPGVRGGLEAKQTMFQGNKMCS